MTDNVPNLESACDSDDPARKPNDLPLGVEWGGGLYNLLYSDGREMERGEIVAKTLGLDLIGQYTDDTWQQLTFFRDCWLENVDGVNRVVFFSKRYDKFGENLDRLMAKHPCYLGSETFGDEAFTAYYFSLPDETFSSEITPEMVEATVEMLTEHREGDLSVRNMDEVLDGSPDLSDPDRQARMSQAIRRGAMELFPGMAAAVHVVDMGEVNTFPPELTRTLGGVPPELAHALAKVKEGLDLPVEDRLKRTFEALKQTITTLPAIGIDTLENSLTMLKEATDLIEQRIEKTREAEKEQEAMNAVASDIVAIMSGVQ